MTEEFVCDFCAGPNPRWCYPAKGWTKQIGRVVLDDPGDGWSACIACHQLIQENDRDALAERAVERFPGGRKLRPLLKSVMLDTQERFWDNRKGDPVPEDDVAAA